MVQLTRREALQTGAAAALAGLAGCSGSIGGSASAYGEWTPEQEGSGAEEGGESMYAIHPSELSEARFALGDRYDAMAAFLDPPVPTLEFGELDTVYSTGGWLSRLYGIEAEFEQDEMVSAYESEQDADPAGSSYEGYELLRVDGTLSSYLVAVVRDSDPAIPDGCLFGVQRRRSRGRTGRAGQRIRPAQHGLGPRGGGGRPPHGGHLRRCGDLQRPGDHDEVGCRRGDGGAGGRRRIGFLNRPFTCRPFAALPSVAGKSSTKSLVTPYGRSSARSLRSR